MQRKAKQIVITIFILGAMFSIYICSSLFADIYTMTDEQYAREAQEIVNASCY